MEGEEVEDEGEEDRLSEGGAMEEMNDDEFFAQVREAEKSTSKHNRRSKKEGRMTFKEERLSMKIKQHLIVEFN
jgi:hypothetical protein